MHARSITNYKFPRPRRHYFWEQATPAGAFAERLRSDPAREANKIKVISKNLAPDYYHEVRATVGQHRTDLVRSALLVLEAALEHCWIDWNRRKGIPPRDEV